MAYSFRRSITIDHTKIPNTDQTNFPVCFSGTYTWLKTVGNGGNVQSASGFDIVFSTDTAASSIIAFERVQWDATTGRVEFYFLVSSLSHTVDTVIYISYGKAGDTDHSNASGVWNANYKAVWHFGDGVTLSLSDSTSNANNLTNHSATAGASQLGGGGGGAAHFALASTQYLDAGNGASLQITGQLTIEAVVNVDSLPDASHFFGIATKLNGAGSNGYSEHIHQNSGGNARAFDLQINGSESFFNPGLAAASVFHVAARYTPSGTFGQFLNGVDHAGAGGPASITDSAGVLTIGGSPLITAGLGISFYMDGFIDELRVSNTARTTDWSTAIYNNLSAPSTFYTVGAEVSNSGGFFRQSNLSGLGAGGPFFQNPLN